LVALWLIGATAALDRVSFMSFRQGSHDAGDRASRARFDACSSRSADLTRRIGQPLALPFTADAEQEDATDDYSDDSVGQRGNDQEQPDGGEREADGQSGAGAERRSRGSRMITLVSFGITVSGPPR
jgi:hypothetical protein